MLRNARQAIGCAWGRLGEKLPQRLFQVIQKPCSRRAVGVHAASVCSQAWCTLNCTVAVDRVATWLGLERDDVAPSDGVVTQLVKIRVPDVDDAFARARDRGARVA